MSVARRTLLTTTAAGTLLCALWFVPSANATGGTAPHNASTASDPGSQEAPGSVTAEPLPQDRLADTGAGIDTTPYVIGGTVSLAVGAGFVAYSARRAGTVRTGF
ncbi:hypothetical protein [Streptomyces sp. B1I3]|uniref:hypothetical protein n=1 Tax=Streptomyces sp. B1I3 TaxID=3042264 RepID=UPI0027870F7D|nr:hypothetical protein [Streptomyces sp. B1I3]MDQ0794351.1 hypothetical protein [Streptomyces sp. B1I3]